jgi:hypothetical protein
VTSRQVLAVLAAMLASAAACAQEERPARWYLQVDNDVFLHTDRWYSSGVRVARVKETGGHEVELGFLHEVYMPEQRYWHPGTPDRAPTARLLLDGAWHTRNDGPFDTIELQAGVRGPSALGEQVTNFIHGFVPEGADVDWSRQLPDRFDASVVATRSMNAGPVRLHFGGAAGTQLVFAHVGGELRFGPGSRDVDFQVMRFAATPPFARGERAPGWIVFAGASARAVAHNAMIGPNYDPGGEDIHLRRAVGRLAVGAAWTFQRSAVTFSLANDTREFEEQRKPQQFGSLAVHWAF